MVGFESVKKWRKMFFVLSRALDEQKFIWVHMRNRTSDLWIPRSDALPQSHRDSIVSETHYEIRVWHLSIFLYGAQGLPSFLFYLQTWRYRHRWFKQYEWTCVIHNSCLLTSRSWQDEKHFSLKLNCFLKSVDRIMKNSQECLYCSFLWKTAGNHHSVPYLSPNWMGSTNFNCLLLLPNPLEGT